MQPAYIQLMSTPNGQRGIRVTLREMARLIEKSRKTYDIRPHAVELVRYLPEKDWVGEVQEIQQYIIHNIRYVGDILGVETVGTPKTTLDTGSGDCDDKVVLAAALLQSIGYEVRLLAVGFNNNPISHVLLEVAIRGRWIPMELTVDIPLGTLPRNVTSKIIQKVYLK